MLKMDVAGIDEIANGFERMASDEVAKYEREAVRAGAEIVQKTQQSLWNRSGKDGEHIQDNVNVGRPYDTADGTKASVGPKMSLRWRAKFVEYGTSYQAPQAPVERSASMAEASATRAMMNVLERVIE